MYKVTVRHTKNIAPQHRDKVERYFDKRKQQWVTVTSWSTPKQ